MIPDVLLLHVRRHCHRRQDLDGQEEGRLQFLDHRLGQCRLLDDLTVVRVLVEVDLAHGLDLHCLPGPLDVLELQTFCDYFSVGQLAKYHFLFYSTIFLLLA